MTHRFTGALFRSAQDEHGMPPDSSVGAVLLEFAAVPERSTQSSLLAGLALLAFISRRRAALSREDIITMKLRPLLAALIAGACACAAQATTVDLAADASWHLFDVTPDLAADGGLGWIDIGDGSALSFHFSVAAGTQVVLSVVDGGFAGDVFSLQANGTALANTSAASNSYPDSIGLDFDAAWAQPRYSRGSYVFGTGSYSVSGALAGSALDDLGAPINATVGAVQLQVSAVPEASTLSSLLAGLGLVAFLLRHRAR